ncbi:peptidoglycan DD-metalloendopeptidase family protein [Paenibacillus sp. strain BS8-2]
MGLRDDVRHRRHEKIRTLLEEYAAKQGGAEKPSQQAELPVKGNPKKANDVQMDRQAWRSRSDEERHLEFPSHPANVLEREDLASEIRNSGQTQDPELAWKRNPNPWSAWGEDSAQGGESRSFVRQTRTYDDSDNPPRSSWSRFLKGMQWKAAAALLIFGGIYGMFHYEADWAGRGQTIVKQALTDEFDFAAVAIWYKEAFAGAPSFIPIFQGDPEAAVGVDGDVTDHVVAPLEHGSLIRTFAEMLNGIELADESEASVVAVEMGRVVMVTEGQDSILIQHANNRVSIYSKLGSAGVSVNDWVEAGDPIGNLKGANESGQSLLHFAIKENDQHVDPLEVITLD